MRVTHNNPSISENSTQPSSKQASSKNKKSSKTITAANSSRGAVPSQAQGAAGSPQKSAKSIHNQSHLKGSNDMLSQNTGKLHPDAANAANVTSVTAEKQGLGRDILDNSLETGANMMQTLSNSWENITTSWNENLEGRSFMEFLHSPVRETLDGAVNFYGDLMGTAMTLPDRLKSDYTAGRAELIAETASYGVGLVSEDKGNQLYTEATNVSEETRAERNSELDIKSEFIQGATAGDSIENPSLYNALGSVALSLTQAGPVGDIRDLITGSYAAMSDPNSQNISRLAGAAIGIVPLFGDAAKKANNLSELPAAYKFASYTAQSYSAISDASEITSSFSNGTDTTTAETTTPEQPRQTTSESAPFSLKPAENLTEESNTFASKTVEELLEDSKANK